MYVYSEAAATVPTFHLHRLGWVRCKTYNADFWRYQIMPNVPLFREWLLNPVITTTTYREYLQHYNATRRIVPFPTPLVVDPDDEDLYYLQILNGFPPLPEHSDTPINRAIFGRIRAGLPTTAYEEEYEDEWA